MTNVYLLIFVCAGLRSRSASVASVVNEDLDIGDEVMIGGRASRQGVIRFKGATKFAPGKSCYHGHCYSPALTQQTYQVSEMRYSN